MFELIKKAFLGTNKKRRMWLPAVLILIVAGLTVSARTWLSRLETPVASIATSAPTQSNPTAQQQEHGLIRLLTSGFSQPEITGPAGQYRLVATRASQSEAVVLQLKRMSGELVQELAVPQEKLNWTTLIGLESGSYTLTVANHPEWV